ncbi:MAG: restriction endonuclease subunit S [Bacteriovorax sp.]
MSKEFEKHNIPESWIWTNIGELGIVVSGGTPSTRESKFWNGNIPWITPADLSGFKGKYISQGKRNITEMGLEYSSAVLLPKNSLLFSSRAPIGYTVISKNKLATNQGFKNIIPVKSTYIDYLYYYLLSSKQLAESLASGTTFLELSANNFSKIPVPLPPLNEQYRIVNRIEELFSELDKAKESLFKARKLNKENKDILLHNILNGIAKETDSVPKEWKHLKIQDCTELIQYGFTAKSSFKIKGPKYLRITDIQDGKVDLNKVPNCTATEEDITKYALQEGDIVFARSGNTVGKTYMIERHSETVLFASYLIRIRCKLEIIHPRYLFCFFQSMIFWKQIQEGVSGIGQPNFNGTKLGEVMLLVPPYDEQLKIIENIEYNSSISDKLQITIDENINKTEKEYYSLFKKAFDGTLVPQDKNDENASELLERITNEKRLYLEEQKIIQKAKPKKEKLMENTKTIIEVLRERNEPTSAEEVWKNSKYSNNIEKFYAELKKVQDQIIETKKGMLSLKK